MSFSDFGGTPSKRTPATTTSTPNVSSSSRNNNVSLSSASTTTGRMDISSNSGGSAISTSSSTSASSKVLTTISDALLQYQRNVGILEKIVQSISSSSSSSNAMNSQMMNETILQYEAQSHVLSQLEEKLKQLLSRQQQQQLPPVSSSASVTTMQTAVMKLQRDYERVQQRVVQLQETASTQISMIQKQSKQQQQQQQHSMNGPSGRVNTNSSSSNMPFFLNNNNGEENDTILQQYQQQQQIQIQEDRLQVEIMREREEEIRNINRGMHTVNEIYKDLAHLVSLQQYDIDKIETQMEESNVNAQNGLQQVEKANEKYGQSNCTIM